jgi:alpha-tubulin suppressor-like RCC1 family protein
MKRIIHTKLSTLTVLVSLIFCSSFSLFAQISTNLAGGRAFTAILCNGYVYAAGNNQFGVLGDSTMESRKILGVIPGLAGVSKIAAGDDYLVALMIDKTLKIWGGNDYGQLGQGNSGNGTDLSTPTRVPNISNIVQLAGGGSYVLALSNSGDVWGWGFGSSGNFGVGTYEHHSSPIKSNLSGISRIAAGGGDGGHMLAVDVANEQLWATGMNNNGQLGDGTTIGKSTAFKVPGMDSIITIAAGDYYSLACKQDNKLWAWGDNEFGQLGTGNTIDQLSPVLTSMTNVKALAAGSNHTLVLKNDGTVWATGLNQHGQLGNGTTTNSTNFVQVTGLTNIVSIDAGDKHSLAKDANGFVYGWGNGSSGQMANNSTANFTSPQQLLTADCQPLIGSNNDISMGKNFVHVYPNPSSTWVNLDFDLIHGESIVYVEFVNALGQKVYSESMSNLGDGSHQQRIKIEKLNTGSYFLRINLDGIWVTQKLLVE